MKIEEQIYEKARALGACDWLKAEESLEELVQLFFTPRGLEFCQKYTFPPLALLRSIEDKKRIEGGGVYLDRTGVALHNPTHTALLGESEGHLRYDQCEAYHLVVGKGARAVVHAKGYAMVFITNMGGSVELHKKENAKIFS